jgi:geranylgeranyl pyrophosphate synthase
MTHDDEDQVIMIRRAVFGKQVEAFLSSEIGKYLLARALEQKTEAQSLFLEINCEDVEKVRQLQNRITQANDVARWLSDAVADGLQALNIIEDRT